MNIKRISIKTGNMRKAADFVVYPRDSNDNLLYLQSDHRCLIIDKISGKGILSRAIDNYPRFEHCTKNNGALAVLIPKEIIDQAIEAKPNKGDTMGGGVVIIG